ncbi:MAG TPA: ATP-dependent DNA helicase RecG [Actinomycetota bacterium]|nr:ATP-dependent DNA helicase RecG [Actinomycetota bacterium]
MSQLTLDSPITAIDARVANRRMGVKTKGPPAYDVLADGLDIRTVGQLLRHYPRRYIDRTATIPIGSLRFRQGQDVTVIGTVQSVQQRPTRRGQRMVTVKVYDGTGTLDLVFFNQPWTASLYRKGVELAVSGRAAMYQRRPQLQNQEVEILRDDAETVHTGRVTPVHRATEGVSTRTIRELVYRALQSLDPLPDPVPGEIVAAESLIDEDRALRDIHFPEDDGARRRAIDRLKFDELFALELGVAYRKHRVERAARGVTHMLDGELTSRFLAAVPFELTGAQLRAMKEIGEDMSRSRPMNRLLQGDVGSGKTVVSLYAALAAVQSGHQATIMAPTEVLAGQHYRTVRTLLAPVGGADVLSKLDPMARRAPAQSSLLDEQVDRDEEAPRVTFALLTAAVTGKDRGRVLEGIAGGEVDLVVGTHALVQEGVEFADLALAVIDEQHRFGVHQRVVLKEKGVHPDVLIMTATPIPRTLALTYYGDLDVSVLDEMPAGRVPATTTVVRTPTERRQAYELVRSEVQAGRQAFVVCAAIDEGNRLEVRAAEHEAARLQTEVFPDLRIALLHGRMRPAEKERVMDSFRSGEADVLISTTVIEVGVDVPNATVMLVENAERFGLAQLHQLRGRIGRGSHRSHCVLFDESGPENEDARARLAAMARTTDGFELADEDLRLRGEGTLFDIKQSGLPDLKLARLAEDAELVGRARGRAFAIIDTDPGLVRNPELLDLLRHTFTGEAIEWLFHS